MAPSCQIPIHILDIDAATDSTIQSVHDYWCGLNGGHPPRRKAFEFMDVYKAAPNLVLVERLADKSLRFIYCGTTVADNVPRDLTGRTLTPQTARAVSVDFAQIFSEVLDTPCWRFSRHLMEWPNDEHGEYILGSGPLTDDAGNRVYVLTCMVFLKKSPFTSRV